MYDPNNLSVTPLGDLAQASRGALVELPSFSPDTHFVARLKRPSLLALVRSGRIPNTLLNTANDLFSNGTLDTKDPKALDNLFEVLESICESAFVEPTYQEILDAGITLTDDQLLFVFNYTQQGVKALENFRTESRNPQSDKHGRTVRQNPQRTVSSNR